MATAAEGSLVAARKNRRKYSVEFKVLRITYVHARAFLRSDWLILAAAIECEPVSYVCRHRIFAKIELFFRKGFGATCNINVHCR